LIISYLKIQAHREKSKPENNEIEKIVVLALSGAASISI